MPDLRILFDSYWWFDGPTSGRNVLRSLVRTWAEDHPGDRLTLTAPRRRAADLSRTIEALGIEASVVTTPAYARIHALAALSTGRMRPPQDVVITQNFAARVPGAVSCSFVHDAMFAEHPEWFLPVERVYLAGIRPTLRRADLVFTSSATEAERIGRVWPEVAPRVRAVGLHTPRDFLDAVEHRPDGVGDEQYVLVVGRLNVRKNLQRLVDAFLRSRLARSHLLLVVGQPDGRGEAIDNGGGRVRFLDRIDDGALRWLYRHASLFVFPSLDEGFGLPLVEAETAGATAIASDIPVFRELGIATGYFDPLSVDDIQRALEEPPGPAPPGGTGSWSDTVGEMREEIRSALSPRVPRS